MVAHESSARRRGRPGAAAVAWRRLADEGRDSRESRTRKRLRGVLQGFGAAAMGSLLLLFWSRTIGTIVLSVAAIVTLAALVSPEGLFAAIERAFLALGRITGRTLTSVLMLLIFYFVFLPFGLVFRRGRRDRMRQPRDPDAPSYWEPRDPNARTSHERQY